MNAAQRELFVNRLSAPMRQLMEHADKAGLIFPGDIFLGSSDIVRDCAQRLLTSNVFLLKESCLFLRDKCPGPPSTDPRLIGRGDKLRAAAREMSPAALELAAIACFVGLLEPAVGRAEREGNLSDQMTMARQSLHCLFAVAAYLLSQVMN